MVLPLVCSLDEEFHIFAFKMLLETSYWKLYFSLQHHLPFHSGLFVHVQTTVVVYLMQWILFLCTCEYAEETKNEHAGLAPLLLLAHSTVCLLNYNLPSRIQLMWVPPSHIIFSLFMQTAGDMGWPVGLCRPSMRNRASWSWQRFPGLSSDHLVMTPAQAVPFESWCYHLADFTARIHSWPMASALLVSSAHPGAISHFHTFQFLWCLQHLCDKLSLVRSFTAPQKMPHVLKNIVQPASSLRTSESCWEFSRHESWLILDI